MFRFERLRLWHKAIELYDVVDCAVEDITKMLSGLKRVDRIV